MCFLPAQVGQIVVFCWVFGHVGVPGRETPDAMAEGVPLCGELTCD